MSIPLPSHYTAVPHAISRGQASFSDGELRVLLAVADQTVGWAEGSGRRESAWISHERFKQLTGKSNDAVSRAIASLVRRGFVRAETSGGRALNTAGERKAHRGQIFYRLAELAPSDNAETGMEAPRTAPTGIDGAAPIGMDVPLTGMEALHRPPTIPDSRFQIPESIKERRKETEASSSPPTGIGGPAPQGAAPFSEEENALAPWGEDAAPEVAEGGETPQERADLEDEKERFVRAFREAYRAARPGETMPPITKEDMELLERRLKGSPSRHGDPQPKRSAGQLEALLPAFFGFNVAFVGKRNWSLDSFLDCFHILAVRNAPPTRVGGWHRAVPDLSRYQRDDREENES